MRKLSLLFSLILISCSSVPPTQTKKVESTSNKERALYEQGLRYLSRNDFKGALKSYTDLLQIYPATKYISGANYNSGLALEGLNDYAGAEMKYKKVIELNEGVTPSKDQAEALYRLSLCYEIMGKDDKLTLTLLQLLDHAKYLPPPVVEMEVPARLAGAYARLGSVKQAKKYYEEASVALRKYRRPPLSGDVLAWLPKTLFSMGRMAPLKKDVTVNEFQDYVNAVTETQGWLVRAAELGNNMWSRQASENLEDIYLSLLVSIREFRPSDMSDKALADKQREEAQKHMASGLDEAISKLRLERLPSSPSEPEPKKLNDAFKTIEQVESRVTEIITARSSRDQDTPEAQARQGIRR